MTDFAIARQIAAEFDARNRGAAAPHPPIGVERRAAIVAGIIAVLFVGIAVIAALTAPGH